MSGVRADRLGLARTFGGLLVAFVLFLVAIPALHYYTDYRAEGARREAGESLNVELARRVVTAGIATVLTDIQFLARRVEGLDLDRGADRARRGYLTEIFLTFAREKGLYDRIRSLDASGREVVRVNHNGGRPEAVPEPRLQDKPGRYYFLDARGLAPRAV